MSVVTSNVYGNISISDEAIAAVVSNTALECYGVCELSPKKLSHSIGKIFKRDVEGSGVIVNNVDQRIYIDVYVVLKYGLSINAVAESLKSAIKYNVESFAGVPVNTINVHITGIKL